MGSSNNHMYYIQLKEGTFKRLLGRRGLKVIDLHEILVKKYRVELKYKSFNNLINNRVNWKIVYATILADYFNIKISDLFQPVKNKEYIPPIDLALNIEEEQNKPKRQEVKFSRIYRNLNKATSLKMLYDYKCQICDKSININRFEKYVESHHILPLGQPHNGIDEWSNMIIVCPNHHIMLDKGAIAIHPETLELYRFNQTRIIKLSNLKPIFNLDKHSIKKEFLVYHWENIFLPNIKNSMNIKIKDKKLIIKRSIVDGV
jgi:hypothetical protein